MEVLINLSFTASNGINLWEDRMAMNLGDVMGGSRWDFRRRFSPGSDKGVEQAGLELLDCLTFNRVLSQESKGYGKPSINADKVLRAIHYLTGRTSCLIKLRGEP
jgi:hypothetical protein